MSRNKRKRRNSEEVEHIYKKLKKLEKRLEECHRTDGSKSRTRQLRSPSRSLEIETRFLEDEKSRSPESQEPDRVKVHEIIEAPPLDTCVVQVVSDPPPAEPEPPVEENTVLDEELLNILGEDPTKNKKYSTPIHNDIASRWDHLVSEGLNKDTKADLSKSHLIPENCQFLEAPTLNPEIKAAVSDAVFKRDRALLALQNQLGQATACLGVALNTLVKEKNTEVTKGISNASRILCDLFHNQSCYRRALIQFALNKDTKDIVSQTKAQKLLFGDNLGEALKAGKAINKTGSEIRYTKPQNDKITKVAHNPALNYRGPPRKQQHPPAPSAGRAAKQTQKPAPQRQPPPRAAAHHKRRR